MVLPVFFDSLSDINTNKMDVQAAYWTTSPSEEIYIMNNNVCLFETHTVLYKMYISSWTQESCLLKRHCTWKASTDSYI